MGKRGTHIIDPTVQGATAEELRLLYGDDCQMDSAQDYGQSESDLEYYNAHEAPCDHDEMLDRGYIHDSEEDAYYKPEPVNFSDYWINGSEDRQRDLFNSPVVIKQGAWGGRRRYEPSLLTSDVNPLNPSYIAAGEGQMGLIICPGKVGSGIKGNHSRDFDTDMKRLQSQGMTRLFGLMPEYELKQYKASELLTKSDKYGIRYEHCGWTDRSIPDNPGFIDAINLATECLNRGEKIGVHCRGGLGRTGTFAGCVLAKLNWHIDDIIEALHDARGRLCPETEEQKVFIRAYAAIRHIHSEDPVIDPITQSIIKGIKMSFMS